MTHVMMGFKCIISRRFSDSVYWTIESLSDGSVMYEPCRDETVRLNQSRNLYSVRGNDF